MLPVLNLCVPVHPPLLTGAEVQNRRHEPIVVEREEVIQMPLFRVYVKTISYGRVHVEAACKEMAEHIVIEHSEEIEVDPEPDENSVFLVSEDDATVQVCSSCEGNPDDGLTDGKCGACR